MDKPTCLWTALILCMAFVAALVDSVFVDGRAPAIAAPAPVTAAGLGAVTSVNARAGSAVVLVPSDLGLGNAVLGSTGITNIWSGTEAAYIAETNTPPGKGADDRTLYLIEE